MRNGNPGRENRYYYTWDATTVFAVIILFETRLRCSQHVSDSFRKLWRKSRKRKRSRSRKRRMRKVRKSWARSQRSRNLQRNQTWVTWKSKCRRRQPGSAGNLENRFWFQNLPSLGPSPPMSSAHGEWHTHALVFIVYGDSPYCRAKAKDPNFDFGLKWVIDVFGHSRHPLSCA